MTLTTWILVFGSLMVTAIVIDGVRRMVASHAALDIDIDDTFASLPIDDYSHELPNGGARPAGTEAATSSFEIDPPSIENLNETEGLASEPLENESVYDAGMGLASEAKLEFPSDTEISELSSDTVSEPTFNSEVLATETQSKDRVDDGEVETELESTFEALIEATVDEHSDAMHVSEAEAFDVDEEELVQKVDDLAIGESFDLEPLPSKADPEIRLASEDSSATSFDDFSALDFDPTRPVHEWVETNAMVQSDLFSAQDLDELPPLKSDVPHRLIETSDDILFSDTGIDEHVAQQDSNDSLSTKLAKVTSLTFGKKLLSRKRAATKESTEDSLPASDSNSISAVEQVISVFVVANQSQGFYGPQLLKLLQGCGMVHGDMDIFHRFEDGLRLGKTQFSMANMLEPGTFDLAQIDTIHTPGVVFFLGLPTAQDSMQAFEYMLETAQCLASNLDGEVLDDQRSVMRPQTIEHCRQQIREFERRNMSRRAQL